MGLLLGLITDIIGLPILIMMVVTIVGNIGDMSAFIIFNLLLIIIYFLV